MFKRHYTVELPVFDAQEHIRAFFDGECELYNTFNALCSHMLKEEDGFLLRFNKDIMGIAKSGEFFRFYVLKNGGFYLIKYKHLHGNEMFISANQELYFSYNEDCNAFFEENLDSLLLKKERRKRERVANSPSTDSPVTDLPATDSSPAEPAASLRRTEANPWGEIKAKTERALMAKQTRGGFVNQADEVYEGIMLLLTDAACDPALISERESVILMKRTLNPSPASLQALGDDFDISRERIRQLEIRAWKKLTNGINHSKKEEFIPYRIRLKEILEVIPEEDFIATIAQLQKHSTAIGEWIQTIIANKSNKKDVAFAVKFPVYQENFPALMRDAALYYYAQLKSTPTAHPVFNTLQSWGIQGESIVHLGLGYLHSFSDGLIHYMTKKKSYTLSQLEEALLVSPSKTGKYRCQMKNCIIIPTINEKGEVVCFDCYALRKNAFLKAPNTRYFQRKENLYSYNLAIRSQKKTVVVVTDYNAFFKLIGLGITNVVSCYSSEISPTQMALLKARFKAVILIADSFQNPVTFSKYCADNDMDYKRMDLSGYTSASEFIEQNKQFIVTSTSF